MSIKSLQEMALEVPDVIKSSIPTLTRTAFCQTVWKELGHIELENGHIAEVQLLITTDGDEWLNHNYADEIFGDENE